VFRPISFALLFAPLALPTADLPPVVAQPPSTKVEPKKEGGFGGRTKAGKKQLLKDFGGSEEGEEAVMLGLAWLTQTQKKDGGWVYDAGRAADTAPATGMAVLAFLGAGQSHKEGRYKQTVQAGLDWLVRDIEVQNQQRTGRFKGAGDMYGQGIATLALCEAYGMTQDPELKQPAQDAVGYIQRAQGRNGSWGYRAGNTGDTSIVGWQIQALHAAQLAGLDVDTQVIKNAVAFLNTAGSGKYKSAYGYNDSGGASAGTSLTAIGLLCRYYIDGWRADNPGFAEGTKGLLTRAPRPDLGRSLDLYYYYYATQVVRFHGGEAWRDWNEGMRSATGERKGGMPDWIISLQNRGRTERGSWDPFGDQWIAGNCGRLGTTCLCLLTLEVYYRYTPESNGNEPRKP
jgi:hypothetical protein